MAQQQSLFGPSIYDVQQQQMQQDRENAIAQARLTPYQSIRAGAAMAGTQAGRSIAGLFGVEDPKLKEASARQELKNAISAQWDGQDPVEAYKIMAKEAARLGLTQEAISAAAQVKAAEESKTLGELKRGLLQAQIGKTGAQQTQAEALAEKARKEKLDTPFGKVDPDKFTPESLDKFRSTGNYADLVAKPDKAKAPPSVGQDREAIAQDMYGTDFYSLTQEQKRAVNKKADERAERLKPSLSVTLPKNLKSIGDVREQFTTSVKPYITAANAAEQSEAMIDQASKGNFQGWRAAITQLAKSVGDSQISRAEIEAYGIDPSLVGSIVDRTNIFLSGTPSQDTINSAKKIASLVKKVNQDRAKQEQGTFLELATQAEGYNPKTTPRFFELPFAPTKQEVQEGTTSSGTKYKLTIK
jgi:putative lipoic acid-binding regulatory protein